MAWASIELKYIVLEESEEGEGEEEERGRKEWETSAIARDLVNLARKRLLI